MMTSVKEQNAEIFGMKERDLQKCGQAELRQNGKFLEALNFKNREDILNLISGKVDLDGGLASRPLRARHVERMKQDNAGKEKVLENTKNCINTKGCLVIMLGS